MKTPSMNQRRDAYRHNLAAHIVQQLEAFALEVEVLLDSGDVAETVVVDCTNPLQEEVVRLVAKVNGSRRVNEYRKGLLSITL